MQNEDCRRFTLSLLFEVRSPCFTLTCLRDAIASIGHLEVAWDCGQLGPLKQIQTATGRCIQPGSR